MKKFRVIIAFLFVFALMTITSFAALQEAAVDPDFPYAQQLNHAIVAAIEGFLGIGLLALIQIAKGAIKKVFPGYDNWPKLGRHAFMYLLTLIVCGGVTAIVLFQFHVFTWGAFTLYTLYTWGTCNGGWKALKEIVRKHSQLPG